MASAPSAARTRLAWVAAFFLINLVLLISFVDRDFYEGDDLNSILPMAHLADARGGLLLIYRYAWQPLSYEVGALLWRLSGTPTAIFLSAAVAGAIALGLMFWEALRTAQNRLLPALLAMAAAPEFWFSSLYYNSTILGLPFVAAAILLLRCDASPVRAGIAGLIAGMAILMRMDFVLICPLLAAIAWWPTRSLLNPVVVAAGVFAMLGIGFVTGILQPHDIIVTQQISSAEIAARAHQPGWDMRVKLQVLTVCLSPIGWLLFVAGTPLVAVAAWRRHGVASLVWPLASLPAAFPLLSVLSPKYAIPALAFMPLLLVPAFDAIDRATARYRAIARPALATIALLPVLIAISPMGHPPFMAAGLLPPRPVGSHDGARGYGGYLWQMIALDGPAAQSDAQRRAANLERRFLAGENLMIVGSENVFDPGGIGWRHLQLRLERAGIHGQLIAPHRLLFQHEGHSLTLATETPGALPPDTPLVDLRGPAS